MIEIVRQRVHDLTLLQAEIRQLRLDCSDMKAQSKAIADFGTHGERNLIIGERILKYCEGRSTCQGR